MTNLRRSLLIFMLVLVMVGHLSLNDVSNVNSMAEAQNTIRVSTTGVDNGSCGGTSNPCRTIQQAVQRSNSGDFTLVAKGTYVLNSAVDPCNFWIYIDQVVCILDKNITINGGYDGQNWSSADPTSNKTIIDGQNAYRGVAVIAYNGTANLAMDGFTIQNAKAQGTTQSTDPGFTFGYGGGMYAENSSVQLSNVDS